MKDKKSLPNIEPANTGSEYTIPLRKEWRKVANYRRAGRAVKEIKKFIARHMKVPDRDLTKVKLDRFLNQEVWFKGKKKPPAKIKVRVVKEGDIVKVELAELPQYWKFIKDKQERKHKPVEKPKEEPREEPKAEEKKEEPSAKTEDEEKAEHEKEKAVAETRALDAKQQARMRKHTTKVKEPGYHRMAMKK